MVFSDEKDYIMRMIKEIVRVLSTLAFGKKYVSVELEEEEQYQVSGNNLRFFLDMVDRGRRRGCGSWWKTFFLLRWSVFCFFFVLF